MARSITEKLRAEEQELITLKFRIDQLRNFKNSDDYKDAFKRTPGNQKFKNELKNKAKKAVSVVALFEKCVETGIFDTDFISDMNEDLVKSIEELSMELTPSNRANAKGIAKRIGWATVLEKLEDLDLAEGNMVEPAIERVLESYNETKQKLNIILEGIKEVVSPYEMEIKDLVNFIEIPEANKPGASEIKNAAKKKNCCKPARNEGKKVNDVGKAHKEETPESNNPAATKVKNPDKTMVRKEIKEIANMYVRGLKMRKRVRVRRDKKKKR